MLVSFNPAFSRSRVSNQNKNLNRAQNPNFKGSGFTPEYLAKDESHVATFLTALKNGAVSKDGNAIEKMRQTINIVKRSGEKNSFTQQILSPIVKAWEKTGRFPANF